MLSWLLTSRKQYNFGIGKIIKYLPDKRPLKEKQCRKNKLIKYCAAAVTVLGNSELARC